MKAGEFGWSANNVDSVDALIVVKAIGGRIEATLWLDDVPVDGRADNTGTLSTRDLVAPLIDRFDRSISTLLKGDGTHHNRSLLTADEVRRIAREQVDEALTAVTRAQQRALRCL